MASVSAYSILADLVLVLHFAYVGFVVVAVPVIWIGYIFRARFVRNPYFRIIHLVCMLIVFAQALAGVICPLTTLESKLRRLAGQGVYEGSFLQHWLHQVLFFQASDTTFTIIYGCFFALIALSFIFIWPDFKRLRSTPR
jgi:hypothetical protein